MENLTVLVCSGLGVFIGTFIYDFIKHFIIGVSRVYKRHKGKYITHDIRIEIKGLKDDCFRYFYLKIEELINEMNTDCDGADVYDNINYNDER